MDSQPNQPVDLFLGDHFWKRPLPKLLPAPSVARGFVLHVELLGSDPRVWRRIEVPGDLLLPDLHLVLQAAMGWLDVHLHKFRTGMDHNAGEFVTEFDLDEGFEGLLEDDVRLDQVVAVEGDQLWYDYDFGDGWEHELRVERVLDEAPKDPTCVAGEFACPPEDCGGLGGHHELALWVRSDFDEALRPEVFDSADQARDWLPPGWHPDVFSLAEANEIISALLAEPIPVVAELAELLRVSEEHGFGLLRPALTHPVLHGATEVSEKDAVRMTEGIRVLLDVIGDGKELTKAGYLKPVEVREIAERTGLTKWWIGEANREDQTRGVLRLRTTVRALGLLAVRKGKIAPTQAARKVADDPQALLGHILSRLPLGKSESDRQAGWMALVVAGQENRAGEWDERVSSLMYDLGWRDGRDPRALPFPASPTLDVLEILSGVPGKGWRAIGKDPAVSAAARSVMRAGTSKID